MYTEKYIYYLNISIKISNRNKISKEIFKQTTLKSSYADWDKK